MGGNAHDRPCSVIHQHIVANPYGDGLPVSRVNSIGTSKHANFLRLFRRAHYVVLAYRILHKSAYLSLIWLPLDQLVNQRVLRRHHYVGHSVNSVLACGENRQFVACLRHVKIYVHTFAAAYPVALHNLDLVRPARHVVKVAQQSLGIVSDSQEPLLQHPFGYRCIAPLTCSVNNLLICKHSRARRTPVDLLRLAIRQPVLVQLEEEPLGPLVV